MSAQEYGLAIGDPVPLNLVLQYESEGRKRSDENFYAKCDPQFSNHC
jgi:hypothetical protein